MKGKYNKKQWTDALKKNEFKVVNIRYLPEGAPILAVTEFAFKALAEFHLVDKVLVPTTFEIDESLRPVNPTTNEPKDK